MKQSMVLAALLLAPLALTAPAVTAPAVATPAPSRANAPGSDAQTLARIKAQMHRLGGRFHDMETLANLVLTPPKGSADAQQNQKITMTAHLWIKMPDQVKFQVLNSNFPLFNRWIFLQKGDAFSAYDPISDRRLTTDFKKLTGREPARVDTSMAMLGLLFDPARYKFQMLGRATKNGKPVYRVRLRHTTAQQLNPLTVIAYTDLYVDTQRLIPVYSASYDIHGNLATTGEFRDARQTPAGWAPTRITITDHEFARLRKKHLLDRARKKIAKKLGADPDAGSIAPQIFGHKGALVPNAYRNGTLDLWLAANNGVLFPQKMLATAPDGAQSHWTFQNTRVNIGLKDSAFRL